MKKKCNCVNRCMLIILTLYLSILLIPAPGYCDEFNLSNVVDRERFCKKLIEYVTDAGHIGPIVCTGAEYQCAKFVPTHINNIKLSGN